MGSFVNTLYTILLGWLEPAASSIWSAFSGENSGTFLQWIGKNWLILAVILCAIGLVTDLCIYLARWRPLRVWKSFFRRLRNRGEEPQTPDRGKEAAEPAASGHYFRRAEDEERTEERPIPDREEEKTDFRPPMSRGDEQEDFSRWASAEPETARGDSAPAAKPLITGAGYTVPADSPYRRPAVLETREPEPGFQEPDAAGDRPLEQELADEYASSDAPESGKPEIMTNRKRKRRLIVSDLFTDPEEDLIQYEKPQQLIDKDKAYHQPVYPRNWKEDKGEEA